MSEKRTGRSGRASSGDFAASVIACAHCRSRLEKDAAIYRERKYLRQLTKKQTAAPSRTRPVLFLRTRRRAYLPPPPSASGAGSSALGPSAGEGAASAVASAAA